MPRLTLIPQTTLRPPACPTEDVRDIIDELTAARDGLTEGPAVLWLVNELMHGCELLFEDEQTGAVGSCALGLARQNFLSRLTGFAEDIRRSNGELSNEFIAFIATAPTTTRPPTTN
tara:strand:+ start:1125 stop:1475 length:351 start_codon:yes stop_codon:yes gene_type:complete